MIASIAARTSNFARIPFLSSKTGILSCNKPKTAHGAIRRFYSGTKRREVQGMMDAICIFAGVIVGTLIARKIDKKRKK